jgi:hypothetical protein
MHARIITCNLPMYQNPWPKEIRNVEEESKKMDDSYIER